MRLIASLVIVVSASAAAADPSTVRPVSTYSIVARDASTGELGVAVQSHWFSVGSVVPWAAAIVVVKGTSSGRPWADRTFDLRVEDHPVGIR